MDWGGVWRVARAPRFELSRRVLAVAVIATTAAGCSVETQPGARLALADSGAVSSATVAFESIDGPPPAVFSKMVTALNDEAGARHVTVVSRSAPATYRVRAYVSALVSRGKTTTFSWVWDVYDADKQRVLRIAGEEPAEGRQRNAWTAADDPTIRRMARAGMERMAAFLTEPQRGTAVAAAPNFMAFALARDDTPEAAGIVRSSAQTP